jgi:hypothetical protein
MTSWLCISLLVGVLAAQTSCILARRLSFDNFTSSGSESPTSKCCQIAEGHFGNLATTFGGSLEESAVVVDLTGLKCLQHLGTKGTFYRTKCLRKQYAFEGLTMYNYDGRLEGDSDWVAATGEPHYMRLETLPNPETSCSDTFSFCSDVRTYLPRVADRVREIESRAGKESAPIILTVGEEQGTETMQALLDRYNDAVKVVFPQRRGAGVPLGGGMTYNTGTQGILGVNTRLHHPGGGAVLHNMAGEMGID